MRRYLAPVLASLGSLQLAQGIWMGVAPRSFYDVLADFGPYDAHLLRDLATWSVALGAVLIVAARRPAWRVPVLVFAALQFGLHPLNHLVDVGAARTTLMGVFDLVSLLVIAAQLVVLVVLSASSPARASASDRAEGR